MDPCPFIRITVSNLGISPPLPTKPSRNLIHPTTPPPCFAVIKLNGYPHQTAVIPYILTNPNSEAPHPTSTTVAAIFHLSKDDLSRHTNPRGPRLSLQIHVFTGRVAPTCGVMMVSKGRRLLGKVCVKLDEVVGVVCDGWTRVGKEGKERFRVCVRADPDPRFVFQFDGEPECSPQVFQTQGRGHFRQPVFSCRFSLRSAVASDRHQRPRSMQSEQGSGRGWLSSFGSDRERAGKERKGWSITVHDLSGSPVAAASMVTPFVASPGSDRVSRSNPGCWLILQPGDRTWKPWGRLEAWRERGSVDGVGYKFELVSDMSSANSGVVLAESTLSTSKGGKFVIDLASPEINININGDSSSSNNNSNLIRGFVMSARVEGEGKCSKPTVEVSVQHVSCTEDAAAFVALAAAVDLSIDACRLFSQKLRKELCQNNDLMN
ncbi:hypothetical protein vseg_012513 [Gypsophila vaccaria]